MEPYHEELSGNAWSVLYSPKHFLLEALPLGNNKTFLKDPGIYPQKFS